MFAEALLGPLLLAAAQLVVPFGHVKNIEQPRAPIQENGPLWAARCDGPQDEHKSAPPVRIHGNSYLVGTCGRSSVLIVGDQGDILIGGGTEGDAEIMAGNIRDLGFRPEDVRFILPSGGSANDVGGIAALQRLSGATVVGSQESAGLRDGQEVRLGNLMVTAIGTPGAPSWRWVSCDGGVCRMVVYAEAVIPAGEPGYRLTDHPNDLAAYRAGIAKIASSPCEILLTQNPAASGMPHRLALGRPLFDPDGCKAYAGSLTRQLDDRVATETATK